MERTDRQTEYTNTAKGNDRFNVSSEEGETEKDGDTENK
jgi:hypothetical protein